MKKSKCGSCGDRVYDKSFIFGLCRDCQDHIIEQRNGDFDRECRTEALRLQEVTDDLKAERIKLKDAKKGLELIKLLKELL